MTGPEHPIHFTTQAVRLELVRSLADIMRFNKESIGIGALPSQAGEDPNPPHDIFDELPGTATVLAGEVGINDDHPWNGFILTRVATPIPSDPNDVEYLLRTRTLKSAPVSIYGNATFRVCTHQGYFRPPDHNVEHAMVTPTYKYVAQLLAGATFDSEIRTRRALKTLVAEGVIDRVIHKPRINWLAAYCRAFRHSAPPPPF